MFDEDDDEARLFCASSRQIVLIVHGQHRREKLAATRDTVNVTATVTHSPETAPIRLSGVLSTDTSTSKPRGRLDTRIPDTMRMTYT